MMAEADITPQNILDFWYASDISVQWFNSTQSLDMRILQEYENIWQQARDGRLDDWRNSPEGCLALAIVLDQFPLNMYRGKAESFATESQAVDLSLWAVSQGFDKQLPVDRVAFLYMPLMHSENPEHQDRSVELFESAGLQNNARFARHHREIVRRFGRFPHRNAILVRTSTRDELDWLGSKEAFKG